MPSPLLFLDFDGVLHTGSGRAGAMCHLAPALDDAIGESPLRIVIASSWRFHRELDEIVAWLPASLGERVVGATGDAVPGRWSRYNEIRQWLSANEPAAAWRALDDAVFEFQDGCPELIACNPRQGFGPEQARTLRSWLDGFISLPLRSDPSAPIAP